MAVCISKPDVTGATEDELPGQSVAPTPCREQIVQALRVFWGLEGLIFPHSWVGSAVWLELGGASPRLEQGGWEELPTRTGKNPLLAAAI